MNVDSIQPTTAVSSAPVVDRVAEHATETYGKPQANPWLPGNQPNHQQVEKALDSINKQFEQSDISLRFNKDEDSGTLVIKLVDQTTGETVRQIPTASQLQISAALGRLQGKIFARKA
jgi:uncharacterized FlaG/YvyC family protein